MILKHTLSLSRLAKRTLHFSNMLVIDTDDMIKESQGANIIQNTKSSKFNEVHLSGKTQQVLFDSVFKIKNTTESNNGREEAAVRADVNRTADNYVNESTMGVMGRGGMPNKNA